MKLIKQIYFKNRSFYIIIAIIVLAIFGNYFALLFTISKLLLLVFLIVLIIDFLLLFNNKNGISGKRILPEKLSNGDENPISLEIKNNYDITIIIKIIDEIPAIFQQRNFFFHTTLKANENKEFNYSLHPTIRGEYIFGATNIFTKTKLGLIAKRYKINFKQSTKVYPSFIQMKKYELLAATYNKTALGIKKIRKIGNQTEFEQIKEYVKGDDFRTINWKATARKNQLMVNQYQEEKAQDIYNIIDMSRTMKMPFKGMHLLDYAINTSLILSSTSINKEDKAGLITFSNKTHTIYKADRKNNTLKNILELLYNQKTDFFEADYERLYITLQKSVKQRSLIFLYTNFEGFSSLKRQINILRKINKSHLLVVVFFENSEIANISKQKANSIEDIYTNTMAETNIYEKTKITTELKKYGIISILTKPENITVNTINKYLEIKARGTL